MYACVRILLHLYGHAFLAPKTQTPPNGEAANARIDLFYYAQERDLSVELIDKCRVSACQMNENCKAARRLPELFSSVGKPSENPPFSSETSAAGCYY
jgi:hypothetical protein